MIVVIQCAISFELSIAVFSLCLVHFFYTFVVKYINIVIYLKILSLQRPTPLIGYIVHDNIETNHNINVYISSSIMWHIWNIHTNTLHKLLTK